MKECWVGGDKDEDKGEDTDEMPYLTDEMPRLMDEMPYLIDEMPGLIDIDTSIWINFAKAVKED